MQQRFKAAPPRFRSFARAAAVTVVTVTVVSACNFSTHPGYSCQGTYVPAITASVTDSASGTNLVNGSTLIVKDGAYIDSTTFIVAGRLAAARDRAGTYEVTVRRNGYHPFHRNGVVVAMDKDGCHAVTAHVEARLQQAL